MQRLTYGDALRETQRIAGWLLTQNVSTERPVAILSDNSIEHALLMLAAMHIGVPAMPISPAYSLQSKDFAKLKSIFERAPPGVVYVSDHARFSKALDSVSHLHAAKLVGKQHRLRTSGLDNLRRQLPKAARLKVSQLPTRE